MASMLSALVFSATLACVLSSAPFEYTRVEVASGIELNVAVIGPASAPPILLLHGFPMASYMWRPMVQPLLDGGYRIIAPDQRGYNTSSKPADVEAYEYDNLISDAKAVIDKLAGGKAHVVGHDWGAVVAFGVAAEAEEAVASLTIINGPHPSVFRNLLQVSREQQRRSMYIYFIDMGMLDNVTNVADDFNDFPWFTGAMEQNLKKSWQPNMDPALNWYKANICGGCTGDFPEHMKSSKLPESMPIHNTPTLVIWGMKDSVFENDANVKGIRDAVTNVEVITFPNGTHFVNMEQPLQVSASVLKHVSKIPIVGQRGTLGHLTVGGSAMGVAVAFALIMAALIFVVLAMLARKPAPVLSTSGA